MPGIAEANSKPAEAGRARPVQAGGVGRPAAGDERLALDRDRRELARQPQDERVDARVGGEHVRAEPDRLDREPARAAASPSSSSSSSRLSGRAKQRAGPPVPIVV